MAPPAMRPASLPPGSLSRPNDSTTITTLLAERAQLRAEIAALRVERDHLARMLNPPPR